MSFGLSGRSLSRSRHDYLDAWAWVGSFDLSHSVWTTSLSTSTVVREALGDQIEMPVITGSSAFADDDREGRFADDDRRMPPPSYPAKAGYPVRCGVGDQIEMPVITGSSAFADDDREGPFADNDRRMPPPRHTPRRRGIQYAAAANHANGHERHHKGQVLYRRPPKAHCIACLERRRPGARSGVPIGTMVNTWRDCYAGRANREPRQCRR